jgi:hypothetical protein
VSAKRLQQPRDLQWPAATAAVTNGSSLRVERIKSGAEAGALTVDYNLQGKAPGRPPRRIEIF